MIVPAQTLRLIRPVEPFVERSKLYGMSYGLGPAGYDVRLRDDLEMAPGQFSLGSTVERFVMPDDLLGYVKDKSTLARMGLCVQNTVIEPGWEGYLTLELTNHHAYNFLDLKGGQPIAQIIFHRLEAPTKDPYRGKYQNQGDEAVKPIFEDDGA